MLCEHRKWSVTLGEKNISGLNSLKQSESSLADLICPGGAVKVCGFAPDDVNIRRIAMEIDTSLPLQRCHEVDICDFDDILDRWP